MQSSNRQKLFKDLSELEVEQAATPEAERKLLWVGIDANDKATAFFFRQLKDNIYILANVIGKNCSLINEEFTTDEVCDFATECEGEVRLYRDGKLLGKYW